jgi:hypothetical protein
MKILNPSEAEQVNERFNHFHDGEARTWAPRSEGACPVLGISLFYKTVSQIAKN